MDDSVLDVDCYYFGCIGGPGHYMHKRGAHSPYDEERTIGAAFGGIDGKLCWNSKPGDYSYNREETEGRAFLTHKSGWTAIAFWDRSVDRRGACNSAFFVRGELTFAQMVRVARHQWPQVWARFTFEVVEVDRSGREIL